MQQFLLIKAANSRNFFSHYLLGATVQNVSSGQPGAPNLCTPSYTMFLEYTEIRLAVSFTPLWQYLNKGASVSLLSSIELWFTVTWHRVPGGYLPAFRSKLAVPIFKVEALTLVISLLKDGNHLTGYAASHYARSQQSEYFVMLLCNLRQICIVMMIIVWKVANRALLSYDGLVHCSAWSSGENLHSTC